MRQSADLSCRYTWGGTCSLDDAVSALESAVDQELKAMSGKREGVKLESE